MTGFETAAIYKQTLTGETENERVVGGSRAFHMSTTTTTTTTTTITNSDNKNKTRQQNKQHQTNARGKHGKVYVFFSTPAPHFYSRFLSVY